MGQDSVKTHLPPGAWGAALCQAGVGKRGLSLYSPQAKSSSHIFYMVGGGGKSIEKSFFLKGKIR